MCIIPYEHVEYICNNCFHVLITNPITNPVQGGKVNPAVTPVYLETVVQKGGSIRRACLELSGD